MAGYQSNDDMVQELSAYGKKFRIPLNKITLSTAYTAGRSYDMSMLNGSPMGVQYGEFLINSWAPTNSFNWTTNGTGLAFTSGFVKTSGTGTTYTADSLNINIVSGRFYRVQFTVSAWTSSNIFFTLGGVTGTNRAATGTFVEIITAVSTAGFVLNASINTGVWTVSNISVVEWGASSGDSPACQQIVSTITPSAYHGGSVSPDYKHLLNMGAMTTAATGVGMLQVVDLLAVYPYINSNSNSAQSCVNNLFSLSTITADSSTDIITHTNINILDGSRVQFSNSGGALPTGISASTNYWVKKQTDLTFKICTSYANWLSNTTVDITADGSGTNTCLGSLPRYTNGAGVRGFMASLGTGYNVVSTVGATPHNITYTYTNEQGTGSRQNPVTVACTASATLGHITHAGIAASNYGPSLPLASGDGGMLQINTLQLSAASGTASTYFNFVLYKELASIPIAAANVYYQQDFLSMLPSLERVYDGATLGLIYVAGGATAASTTFIGHLETGWA